MADERYQWLDQEAAERLLRGEPVEAVDDRARAEAARLAEALGTARVPAVPPAAGTELPGEAAALAAFRKATAERAATAAAPAPVGPATLGELGRIRIAPVTAPARRWGRSLRYGLAAAVAAVTVGGVAVAAGTGVLPLIGPAPASSVSAGGTTDPLVSEDPGIRPDPETPPTEPGDGGDPTPGPSPSADSGSTAPTPRTPDGRGTVTRAPGTPTPGRTTPGGGDAAGTGPTAGREQALQACREYRKGNLDATGRQQLLKTLRNGDTLRVYCDRILSGDTGTSEGGGQDSAGGGSKGDGKDDSDDSSDGDRATGSKGGSKGGSGSGSASAGGSGDQRGGTGNQNGGARLDTGVTAVPPAGITAGTRLPLGV
ncbi:hypothetical protein GCM10010275_06210 [Streptomyces litmocidini]|uniref:hypothetical protein n=1 Tax=Streptomyces litmocidini TaxID=67318 RepID=UPI00167C86CC|nr:hypothetical protein [Streptomyces litmocidini]GGU74271.1 hypothetical protein GCM10010275_06210 [Streptomyces litmocidini]